MKDAQKHKVLKDLAETLDFAEVLKRNPELSKNDARHFLLEMADGFICKAAKKHQTPDAKHLIINVDGASRGNPGKAGIGAVIRGSDNTIIERVSKYIGIATNNIAEYQALILALETAKQIGAEKISIYSDSELMVKQIKGEYRVKNEGLKPLYQKAIGLLKDFKAYGIIHVEREKNKEADKLANQAIDESS